MFQGLAERSSASQKPGLFGIRIGLKIRQPVVYFYVEIYLKNGEGLQVVRWSDRSESEGIIFRGKPSITGSGKKEQILERDCVDMSGRGPGVRVRCRPASVGTAVRQWRGVVTHTVSTGETRLHSTQ